jgi:hypothetical protein
MDMIGAGRRSDRVNSPTSPPARLRWPPSCSRTLLLRTHLTWAACPAGRVRLESHGACRSRRHVEWIAEIRTTGGGDGLVVALGAPVCLSQGRGNQERQEDNGSETTHRGRSEVVTPSARSGGASKSSAANFRDRCCGRRVGPWDNVLPLLQSPVKIVMMRTILRGIGLDDGPGNVAP